MPPGPGPERDAFILDRVVSGAIDPISFATITAKTPDGKHVGTFEIMADALRLDGVRVNVSARLAQQIADVLGASLLTAKLADLLYLQRGVTLLPSPQPISASTLAMVEHSARIDAEIRAALTAGTKLLPTDARQTVGKHWILDNDTSVHAETTACNYGWHFPGPTFGGSAWESAVTPGLRLIQGRGWAHTLDHVDYSQTCVLVANLCTVDGQPAHLADVFTSTELAPLASAQGPLKVLRQAGVPFYVRPGPRGGGLTGAEDVQLPLHPPDVARCPHVTYPALASVEPWRGSVAPEMHAWAQRQLVYPLGTVIRDTVAGRPVVGRVECHPPEKSIPVWHKGVTIYTPLDPSSGSPLMVAPPGWPSSGAQ